MRGPAHIPFLPISGKRSGVCMRHSHHDHDNKRHDTQYFNMRTAGVGDNRSDAILDNGGAVAG